MAYLFEIQENFLLKILKKYFFNLNLTIHLIMFNKKN